MAYHRTTLRSNKNILTLDELHLNPNVRAKINQLLEEYAYSDALSKHHIALDNKILLHGHSGCGKTATANAIAHALGKKLYTINLSAIVSSKLGETAKNLATIFKEATIDQGIIFIDEFDFIGKLRDYDEKDSGEMKRLVNALIQQIDHLPEHTLLIGATNHIHIIDTALLRRFQIKLNYELPTREGLDAYYDSLLSRFPKEINNIERHYGISYAEAKDIANQQVKANIIRFEKQKKHKLFSYAMHHASLPNTTKPLMTTINKYRLEYLKNGTNKAVLISTGDNSDKIDGDIIEITGEELLHKDKQFAPDYKRITITSQTDEDVWIYVLNKTT